MYTGAALPLLSDCKEEEKIDHGHIAKLWLISTKVFTWKKSIFSKIYVRKYRLLSRNEVDTFQSFFTEEVVSVDRFSSTDSDAVQ